MSVERKYKGFLYIKCGYCGKEKSFCSKIGLEHYKCQECGSNTNLAELIPMHLNCECGKYTQYMTNMDEPAFDARCIACDSPVAVKYNDRKRIYETIK